MCELCLDHFIANVYEFALIGVPTMATGLKHAHEVGQHGNVSVNAFRSFHTALEPDSESASFKRYYYSFNEEALVAPRRKLEELAPVDLIVILTAERLSGKLRSSLTDDFWICVNLVAIRAMPTLAL